MNIIDKSSTFLELIAENKINIPLIQRDYAQGRQAPKVKKIRDKFLDALFNALKSTKRIELDFIYGYNIRQEDEMVQFVPLDGQQRLTTLFLLHWYIAVREGISLEQMSSLHNFTYEVRHSSKEFCRRLVSFRPESPDANIAEAIYNEPWFFADWNYDPTISGMLVMIKEIQRKYEEFGLSDIWLKLSNVNAPIAFYCLPMDKLGLTDSLYIKMNSRGKPLTEFEIFKSNFSTILPEKQREVFNHSIDKEWLDMFWEMFSANSDVDIAQEMDEGMMRYFHFVTDILAAVNNINISETEDLFEKSKLVYHEKPANISWLFDSLNCLEEIEDYDDYFGKLFYINKEDFTESKSRLFFNSPTPNILKKCLTTYHSSLKKSQFAFGERLLLYAVIVSKKEKTEDFNNRLRALRNLAANSEDEMRQEYYAEFLNETKDLICTGQLSINQSRFNTRQKEHEIEKSNYLKSNPLMRGITNNLEDHNILRGNLLLFDLHNNIEAYANSFHEIFYDLNEKHNSITRALMTIGDYSKAKSKTKKLYGSSNEDRWRDIFTPTRGVDFSTTKSIVLKLLHLHFEEKLTLEGVVENYLETFEQDAEKPKGFNYYFIKYDAFLFDPWQYGFYNWWWNDALPYEEYKMNKEQFNGKHWSPFLLELSKVENNKLTLDDNGDFLELKIKGAKFSFLNFQKGYTIEINKSAKALKTITALVEDKIITKDEEEFLFKIPQSNDGLDITDRVSEGKKLLELITEYHSKNDNKD